MAIDYYCEWLKTYVSYILCEYTIRSMPVQRLQSELPYRCWLEDQRYMYELSMRCAPEYQLHIPEVLHHYNTQRHNEASSVSKWLAVFKAYVEACHIVWLRPIESQHLVHYQVNLWAALAHRNTIDTKTWGYTQGFIAMLEEQKKVHKNMFMVPSAKPPTR